MVDSLEIARAVARRSLEEYIFGEGSTLTQITVVDTPAAEPLMSSLNYYEVAVVLCLVLYIIWVMRYTSFQLNNMVGGSMLFSASSEAARDANLGSGKGDVDNKSLVSDRILSWSLVVGLTIILSTRIVDWVSGSEYLGHFATFNLSREIVAFGFERWCVGVALAFVGSLLWGAVVLFVSELLTGSDQLLLSVMRFKSQMILLSVVWLLPVVLLSSFESDNSFMVYLTGVELLVLVVIYLIRSFLLFTAKKISILQWFLYLCTVEILPITFAWAIFTRSVSV